MTNFVFENEHLITNHCYSSEGVSYFNIIQLNRSLRYCSSRLCLCFNKAGGNENISDVHSAEVIFRQLLH